MTQDTYGREILHCSQGTASQKLSGQLALSALDIFHSATAFNVSTDYLYGLTDTRTRKIESVDELQFASVRRMKPIQHFPNQ